MVVPIALAVAKRLKISLVGMVIAIAVSSNLQGVATLVGDTTSILLGGYADMNFLDFFIYEGKLGIFFAVELGALVSAFLLLIIFKKESKKVQGAVRTVVTDYVPTILLLGTVALLVLASLLPNMPDMINGIICVPLMMIGVLYNFLKKCSVKALTETLKEIDLDTLLLLFGLFIVVGGITEMGVVDAIARLFTKVGGGNVFIIYTLIA